MIWLYWLAVGWGVLYGLVFAHRPRNHLRAFAKTAAVTLLAVAAVAGGLPQLLVAALAFSALGDGLLAYEGEKNFLAGLVSFLLAHLCYTALFFASQDPVWSASLPFFAATIAVLAFALAVFRRLRPHLGSMRLPVALYSGVLSAMAVAALARGPDPLLIGGVIALLASDAVLAFERFVFTAASSHRRWSGPVVWFAYLLGQALVFAAMVPVISG